ncbi:Lrp/AsnC family transcriptional regulator [Maritalea myrionectae]|uniref:Lrp/AsnC family transcriptional regulator n=1 Tax=Maritalea myrionectae TaxID=454601 RepID=UPI000487DBE0|nr:Lrp/AsnC family transcriptional regulator [Maritalea myrionectae]
MFSLDQLDKRIIRSLQADCRISMQELGEQVGLSTSACHRRVKLLEERKLISGYHAHLDPDILGFGMLFYVEVSLTDQSEATLVEFEDAVRSAPEILEASLVAGASDYLLRLVCEDADHFERLHRTRLSRLPHVARIQSNLAIRVVKPMTGLPV